MKGESLLFSVSSVDVFFQDVLPERNPKVPPQSLFVWSRNSSWRGERNDGTRRLWGRSLVFSVPVKYGEEEDPPESRGIEVVALSYWEDGKEDIAVRTIDTVSEFSLAASSFSSIMCVVLFDTNKAIIRFL